MYSKIVTDVFFDLDHTLWDFEKNSALTFEKILLENQIPVDLDDFLKVYVPNNLVYWRLFREDKISKTDLRYQRLKVTFDSLGLKVSDVVINHLSEEYIAHLSSNNHLFPNALEVLNYLKPKYQLHIITNGFQEVQDKKIKNSKIDSFFTHVINSEMAGVKKPNPIIFELALHKANTVPEKSLMIGDSLEADIIGAKASGFHVLHFNAHNEERHNICDIITELDEIKSYL